MYTTKQMIAVVLVSCALPLPLLFTSSTGEVAKAVNAGGADSWPIAWRAIDAVPYELIITMPHSAWVSIAQLGGFFLAVLALVVFACGKKLGYGWSCLLGLLAAVVVVASLFLSIAFGPKRFEPIAPIERPKTTEISPALQEQITAYLCASPHFPSDMETTCAKRNPEKRCHSVGQFVSTCEAANTSSREN